MVIYTEEVINLNLLYNDIVFDRVRTLYYDFEDTFRDKLFISLCDNLADVFIDILEDIFIEMPLVWNRPMSSAAKEILIDLKINHSYEMQLL